MKTLLSSVGTEQKQHADGLDFLGALFVLFSGGVVCTSGNCSDGGVRE